MGTFNKEEFSELLKKAKGNRSINQYGLQSGVSGAHISRLLRGLLDTPPNPDTIKLLADKAHNGVTYYDLMIAAGHINKEPVTSNELKSLQKNIHELRNKLGFSIEELAEKIGWKPETLEAFEENPTKIPGQKTLDKLAEALEVTRDYLLGYTDDPKGYGAGVYPTDSLDLKEFIANNKTLNYGGDVIDLDEETKAFFDQQLRMAFYYVKEKNKEKYGKKKGSKKGE